MTEHWQARLSRGGARPMLKLTAVARPAELRAARRPVRRLLLDVAARVGLRNTVRRVGSMPSDTVLVATLIILTGSGLAVLLSASYFYGERLFDDPLRCFRRPVLWVARGVLAAQRSIWLPISDGIEKPARDALDPLLVHLASPSVPIAES